MDAYELLTVMMKIRSGTKTKNQDLTKMIGMFLFTFRPRTDREPWRLASLWARKNILKFWGNPSSSENSETAVE